MTSWKPLIKITLQNQISKSATNCYKFRIKFFRKVDTSVRIDLYTVSLFKKNALLEYCGVPVSIFYNNCTKQS